MANKITYSEKLQDPRWQKKRLEVLERDQWSCTCCFSKKNTLHVHHEKYSGEPWEVDSKHLKTVCKYCHDLITWMEKNNVDNISDCKIMHSQTGFCKFCVFSFNGHVVRMYQGTNGEYLETNFIDEYELDQMIEFRKFIQEVSNG